MHTINIYTALSAEKYSWPRWLASL